MSQVFTVDGEQVPVTIVEVGPCKVVQVKTKEKDGYTSVQIGFGKKSKSKMSKAAKGHQKGQNFLYLNEFRISEDDKFKTGDEIKAADFQPGEYVDVSGVMKGRGFAGVMKRHGFHGVSRLSRAWQAPLWRIDRNHVSSACQTRKAHGRPNGRGTSDHEKFAYC